MKTTNLEYTNIPVLLPDIDFFLNKIENNEPFHFLRANHGIIDLIHLGYPNLSEFENLFLLQDYESIAEKMIKASKIDVNAPLETYHRNSDIQFMKQKMSVFLKVLKEYKNISPKIEIGLSLGVGLHTHWGVWSHNHPYQLGRSSVASILHKNTTDNFYYSGVLKHFTIKNEIFQLFETLNNKNFLVIFVGRNYLNFYEDIFKIKNFKHIKIPNHGAINFIDDYIDEIKKSAESYENTIVLHSTGHILSFYIAHQLADTNIFGLDIGRSFDLLVKKFRIDNPDIPQCWITHLDETGLNNYVNQVRQK